MPRRFLQFISNKKNDVSFFFIPQVRIAYIQWSTSSKNVAANKGFSFCRNISNKYIYTRVFQKFHPTTPFLLICSTIQNKNQCMAIAKHCVRLLSSLSWVKCHHSTNHSFDKNRGNCFVCLELRRTWNPILTFIPFLLNHVFSFILSLNDDLLHGTTIYMKCCMCASRCISRLLCLLLLLCMQIKTLIKANSTRNLSAAGGS